MTINVIPEGEQAIVILRPKKIYNISVLAIFFMGVLPFFVFGMLMPVLTTGSYESIWPAGDKNLVKKIIIFYTCLSLMPCIVPQLKVGNYAFYSDRLEVIPFIFRTRIVMPYNIMHVWFLDNWNMTIAPAKIPSLWRNPIRRMKVQYLKGLCVGIAANYLENPSDVSTAVQLVKERALEFTRKDSLYF